MAPSGEKEVPRPAARVQAGTPDHRGDNRLARQLLKPRRRAQIEVWLDETVSEQETQCCTAGREFGHRSDSLMPQPAGQPGESPRSTPVIEGICPVCGRSSGGEGGPPPRLAEGKVKHMLRGIMGAMGQFRARDAGKGGKGGGGGSDEDEDDKKVPGRAVTAMFLAEASGDDDDDDGSVATVFSSSGRFGGGEGKALEERLARLMRAQKLLEKSQGRRG
ncbi:hypothetical protein KVR01_005637 [Diaporthe batatas]|uniref:uncharacterized protein n=1 Tax=Diaporthe batatas TaxID=748121 RepID=UPI001D058596|nr:uncharacterized protein KVR01_005637 [Diaporthe batatas]KAG8165362.1 hypothetical protein KVR01_005637 [Diaporthe batatas]